MSNTNNRPQFLAKTARELPDGKTFYSSIGSAFEMKGGKGYTILLDALPIGNRILLFPNTEKTPPAKAIQVVD